MVKMAVFVAVMLATSAVMVEGACYMSQSSATPIPGCTCHPSCATCGYNSAPDGEADCITCASTSDTLFPVYSDGTGTCGAQATVSTESECSAWIAQFKSSAVSGSGSSAMDMDTDAAGTTFEDQFRACQTGGYHDDGHFPDGQGLCTPECQNLYDSVLPAARAAGRADCWESRYYGVYYSMNCLTDQNGNSCGGMMGILNQMNSIVSLYSNEMTVAESGQFNETHKFQSNLNQSTMASTCGSTCFEDGIFMMMEMDSNNGVAGQGVDASMYDYLAAFGSYVCQEVSGQDEYCFPKGMTSMVNIFMNDPFDASINDLDTFCSVQDRCPKLSMAKYISIFEFMPGPSNANLIQQFTELMEFDCMKHDTTYCLRALGGGGNDPPECGDGESPDTSNAVCRSWLINTINNAGCCVHAYDDLMNTMNSLAPSGGGVSSSCYDGCASCDGPGAYDCDSCLDGTDPADADGDGYGACTGTGAGTPSDGGSGNGNKLMKELGGPEPVQQHDRKSIHRALLNLAETKLDAALAFKGWSPAAAKSQKQAVQPAICQSPPTGCTDSSVATNCCAPTGSTDSTHCPTECVSFATSCCPPPSSSSCTVNGQVVPMPTGCDNAMSLCCAPSGSPDSTHCPTECSSFATQCCPAPSAQPTPDPGSGGGSDDCIINGQVVPMPQECENADQAACCATGGPTSACPSACHSFASQCCGPMSGTTECYNTQGDTTPIQGCSCHPSCATCGYSSNPNGANDCIACADGSPVSQVYPDGTGNCGGAPMSVRGVVEAVGIDFDALPDACPVTKYKLPVELQFQDMLMETCVELLSLIVKDIAASVGVVPDQVIGAACAQLTSKSSTGVKINGQVGVPTQAEANAMNTDIQLSNTKAQAAKAGLAVGSATVTADTNNVVLATLTASPSPTASLSTGASPSNSPSGPAPSASASGASTPTGAAAAVHAATTLALAAVGAALLWR